MIWLSLTTGEIKTPNANCQVTPAETAAQRQSLPPCAPPAQLTFNLPVDLPHWRHFDLSNTGVTDGSALNA